MYIFTHDQSHSTDGHTQQSGKQRQWPYHIPTLSEQDGAPLMRLLCIHMGNMDPSSSWVQTLWVCAVAAPGPQSYQLLVRHANPWGCSPAPGACTGCLSHPCAHHAELAGTPWFPSSPQRHTGIQMCRRNPDSPSSPATASTPVIFSLIHTRQQVSLRETAELIVSRSQAGLLWSLQ